MVTVMVSVLMMGMLVLVVDKMVVDVLMLKTM